MTSPDLLIADLVEELCDPHQHREQRWTWSPNRNRVKLPDHVTIQPGLLTQLHDAILPSMSLAGTDSSTHHTARSTPPLQIEALNAYLDIAVAAADWTITLGVTVRPTLLANVRALAGARHGNHTTGLVADLRRWRGWAATMTGWQQIETPRAWCPVIDCPADSPGTLRVNLTNQTAVCTACRSWWDQTTIGILADHIAIHTPHERIPIRSTIEGHGGWVSRATVTSLDTDET